MAANIIIVLMMLMACYVHVQPGVSHEVLPLKIKPPFIPLFFLLLAAANMYLTSMESEDNKDITDI